MVGAMTWRLKGGQPENNQLERSVIGGSNRLRRLQWVGKTGRAEMSRCGSIPAICKQTMVKDWVDRASVIGWAKPERRVGSLHMTEWA